MKKFDLLEECFAQIPAKIHKEIDLSFDIVNRIHKILSRQGKTQKDLAKALGKRESEISKWMRGTHNFTIDTIAKISAALDEDIIKVVGVQRNDPLTIRFELKTDKYAFFVHKYDKANTSVLSNSSDSNLDYWLPLRRNQSRNESYNIS